MGLTYFKEALQVDPHFVPYLITSMKSFATDIPVIIIFSLFIASVLNTKFHGRGLARVIFFVPVILATGVISSVEASTNIISVVEEGRSLDTGLAAGDKMEIASLLTSVNLPEALVSLISSSIAGIYRIGPVQRDADFHPAGRSSGNSRLSGTTRPRWRAATNGSCSGKSPSP